jgi:hypothetical protein
MAYDIYFRVIGCFLLALGCFLFYNSWQQFYMSIYLMRHGVITKGHWQTTRLVRFVTEHNMHLTFTSFTSSTALKKNKTPYVLYDSQRPGRAYFASSFALGYESLAKLINASGFIIGGLSAVLGLFLGFSILIYLFISIGVNYLIFRIYTPFCHRLISARFEASQMASTK